MRVVSVVEQLNAQFCGYISDKVGTQVAEDLNNLNEYKFPLVICFNNMQIEPCLFIEQEDEWVFFMHFPEEFTPIPIAVKESEISYLGLSLIDCCFEEEFSSDRIYQ